MKKLLTTTLTSILSFLQPSCSLQQKNLVLPSYPISKPVPIMDIPQDLEDKLKEFWRETDSWFIYQPDEPSLLDVLFSIDNWSSAEETKEARGGDCDDYFLYSCSKLLKPGFNKQGLLFLRKYKNKFLGAFDIFNLFARKSMHIVHLLEYQGLYGSSGQTSINQYLPQYKRIEDLVNAHSHNGVYEIQYAVLDISDIPIEKGRDNKFLLVKDRFRKLKWKRIER